MIIYFSGCGNSRHVANALGTHLNDLRIAAIEGDVLAEKKLTATGEKRIVWVFPVYSWGVPPIVAKFILEAKIEGAERAEHHCVMTCGDDAGLTDSQWRKLIADRGWRALSASSVIMPNTYTLMKGFDVDEDEAASKKIKESAERIKEAAGRIIGGKADSDICRGKFAWIKSRIIYPWFKRFAMSPKPFHFSEECVGCGLCAKGCPTRNITLKPSTRRPIWGNNCALCLRCYHSCPTHAVEYGNATKGKGQYLYKP